MVCVVSEMKMAGVGIKVGLMARGVVSSRKV